MPLNKFSDFSPSFKVELESSEATTSSEARISKELLKTSEFLNHFMAMLLAMQTGNFVHPAMLELAQAAGMIHRAGIAAAGASRIQAVTPLGRA